MKSSYQDRDTVGAIYLNAQKNCVDHLTLADVNEPMVSSLVDDLNATIESNPFEGRPFYINIVEERDLLMPNAIKRRIFKSLYLPFPEDNTLVFHTVPKENKTYYCWDLPHHSEFVNIFINQHAFPSEYIKFIKAYLNNDLSVFGFIKVRMNSALVEGYDEKQVIAYKRCYHAFLDSLDMDPKTLESEKAIGYFWIPNPNFRWANMCPEKIQIVL